MTRILALASGLALLVLLGVTYYLTLGPRDGDRFAQCRASSVAGGAGQIGGPFTLINASGETMTETEVIDQPSLIYFGYTFCPDICPLDMVRNIGAVDILEAEGETVKPVFITIDPERDTPEVLQAYGENLHPRLLALTGSAEQVKTAADAYRAFYSKRDTGDDYYLMDHSTFTYLSLPDHGFVEFFRRDTPPEQVAERVQCFLDAG